MEQYRSLIDGVLAGAGIDYRDNINSAANGAKLQRWIQSNPNHPLSKYVASRQGNIVQGTAFLSGAVRQLKSGQAPSDEMRQVFGMDAADAAANPQAAPAPDENAAVMARIKAFTDELARAPGMDDPVFAGLIGAGRAAASQSIGQTGIRGGLADLATAQMAQKTALPYLQQRQSLRAQGLGMQSQQGLGMDAADRGWASLDLQAQQMKAGEAEKMWAQQQNQGQSVGSAIGGALGLGAGVLAAGLSGGALAPAIPAFAAGGSAIGGGIGGQSATPYKPYNYAVNRGGRSAFSGGSY
jgi:hypothetical protein